MKEQKEDIHETSVKGVGEPNPPRKQGETAEGKPMVEKPVIPTPKKEENVEPPVKSHHKK